ncbi:MAG: Entericidin EcnA/B family [Pseudomonadota bacterium]|jgi:predicted small secreted protein
MCTLPRILLLIAALGLTACNTVAGVGKDLQKGGEFIEKKASK